MSQPQYHYWAFISYSHLDSNAASKLHRALERYVVPRRLVGRTTAVGELPRRLHPIFRDRDELPTSAQLGAVIDEALQQSRYLIVVCSPNAAKSRWVNEEIKRFKEMGRARQVLTLIIDGEPNSADPKTECFPPQLRWILDPINNPEPIAADARPGGDGKSLALMKLLSGLLGVGLDDLLRRQRRRRLRQGISWIAIGGVVVVLSISLVLVKERYDSREHAAYIATLVENGRQELLAGSQMRAAVYLSEAYKEGVQTPALRFMLHQAMQPIDALERVIDTGAPIRSMQLSSDDSEMVTLSNSGEARVWSMASGLLISQFHAIEMSEVRTYCGPIFSDDNRWIAISTLPIEGSEGSLNVWSANAGVKRLEAPITNANCTMSWPFSSNGSNILSIDKGGIPTIRDLSQNTLGRETSFKINAATAASYSPDGQWLAVGTTDGVVRAWRTSEPSAIIRLSGLNKLVRSIDFDVLNEVLIAVSEDGSMRGWKLPHGEVEFAGGQSQQIFKIELARGVGRLLTVGLDGERVWNTTNGALLFAGSGGSRLWSSLRADGQQLAQVEWDNTEVRDVGSSRLLFKFDIATNAAAFTKSGRTLITADPKGRIMIWNGAFRPLSVVQHGAQIGETPDWWSTTISFAQLKGGQIISGGQDGKLLQSDVRSPSRDEVFANLEAPITRVHVSANGNRIVASSANGSIGIWDVASHRLLQTLNLKGKFISTLFLSPDANYVFAADRGNRGYLWRVGSEALLREFSMDSRFAIDFSPDSSRIALGQEHRVEVIKLTSMVSEFSEALGEKRPPIGCLKFKPDGMAVFAMADDDSGAMRLISLNGEKGTQARFSKASGCFSARFSPDGERVLALPGGPIATIWQPKSGSFIDLQNRTGAVFDADWSPDGSVVITSGTDGLVQLSNSLDGQLLTTIAIHAGSVGAAEFSHDGKYVYTGGDDNRLQSWDASLETRSATMIADRVTCVSPWRLDGIKLSQHGVDVSRCVGSPRSRASFTTD